MKQYRLINKKSGEEHICTKVNVDGFDYYVNDEPIKESDYYYDLKTNSINQNSFLTKQIKELRVVGKTISKVITTNNPNMDILKVINEGEKLANNYAIKQCDDMFNNVGLTGAEWGWETALDFKAGYNKHKETNPFSGKDMIELLDWINKNDYEKIHGNRWCKLFMSVTHSSEELLQIWEEQRVETIYFE